MAIFFASSARADFSLPFNIYYGASAVDPGTPAPWSTLTFTDVSPGNVLVTISNSPSLLSSAKLDLMYFNFNTNLNLSSLTFTPYASSGSFTAPTISKGTNAFMAGGDGRYDIKFAFATGGGTSATFGAGEWVTYQIGGIGTLTANDFLYLATSGGGATGGTNFYAAGHLLGLGNGQKSAWIAPGGLAVVPEPSSAALIAFGGGALVLRFARRRK